MKVPLCFTLVIACVSASAKNLIKDLKQITDVIPNSYIIVGGEHVFFDQNFRKAVAYVQSDEFQNAWRKAEQSPQLEAITSYLGPDIVTALKATVERLVSLPQSRKYSARFRVFENFTKSVLNTIPKQKIKHVVKSLHASSPAFKSFHAKVFDKQFYTLFRALLDEQDFSNALSRLKAYGVDLEGILNHIFALLQANKFGARNSQ